MNSENGFLLSYIKYGDNDAVIHCFTQEKGYQSYFSRGIYSSKNKKKAYLLPLNEVSIISTDFHKTGKLKSISKIEPLQFFDFYTNVKINAILFFVSDFLNQILRNENKNEELYEEIAHFTDELEKKNYQSHLIFLFRILKIQGLNPLTNKNPFLDPEIGNFVSEKTHQLFDVTISELWKNLNSVKKPYEINIDSKLRKNFLESILIYYHYHYTDFRTPQSLEIVQQLF